MIDLILIAILAKPPPAPGPQPGGDRRDKFMPESDPRIKQLASQAAKKIKSLRTENEQEIEAIYRHFCRQARAIKAEASATVTTPSTGPDQTTEANQS